MMREGGMDGFDSVLDEVSKVLKCESVFSMLTLLSRQWRDSPMSLMKGITMQR